MHGITAWPSEDEQAGAGVRELHQRFKAAGTLAELHAIAAVAEQRRTQPGLPPSVETAYRTLNEVAQQRMYQLEETQHD